ncbi:MAG: hypothetical protein U0075_20235 [Thermomicrobiales bacterium]
MALLGAGYTAALAASSANRLFLVMRLPMTSASDIPDDATRTAGL